MNTLEIFNNAYCLNYDEDVDIEKIKSIEKFNYLILKSKYPFDFPIKAKYVVSDNCEYISELINYEYRTILCDKKIPKIIDENTKYHISQSDTDNSHLFPNLGNVIIQSLSIKNTIYSQDWINCAQKIIFLNLELPDFTFCNVKKLVFVINLQTENLIKKLLSIITKCPNVNVYSFSIDDNTDITNIIIDVLPKNIKNLIVIGNFDIYKITNNFENLENLHIYGSFFNCQINREYILNETSLLSLSINNSRLDVDEFYKKAQKMRFAKIKSL